MGVIGHANILFQIQIIRISERWSRNKGGDYNEQDRLHKSGRAAAPTGIRPGLHPEGAAAGDLVGSDASVLLHSAVSGSRVAGQANLVNVWETHYKTDIKAGE